MPLSQLCLHLHHPTRPDRFNSRADEIPKLYLHGKHAYEANLNLENALGTIASIEHALRRLDRDAEEGKARLERMEKALTDHHEQQNRPFEHEGSLRELLTWQQDINKQLDLDEEGLRA